MTVLKAHKQLVEIATEIETDWRRVDNETAAFPEIVEKHAVGADFSALGDLANIPRLLENGFVASLQEPSTFSDVYLKLFDNSQFYIELLNWWGSDINIHDHDFAGMQFQLTGSSLNVEYAFEEDEWSPRLTVGTVSVKNAEIWEPGDHSFVRPGPTSAHTVNHLGFPTVSLLIRTHGTAAHGPQRNYFPPFIAGDYGVATIVFRKRVSLLRTLSRGPIEPFHRAFKEVVDFQSPTENLFLLTKMFDILFQEQNTSLLSEFIRSYGATAEATVHVAAYLRASDFILNHVKRIPGLSDEQILACSVLGACFDLDSCNKITGDLLNQGYSVDIDRLFVELEDKLCASDKKLLTNIYHLFELDTLTESNRFLKQPQTNGKSGLEHSRNLSLLP